MANYKTHLVITDKKGNFRRYACSKKWEQDATHDVNKVTCINCSGKTNPGLVVEGFGFYHSPLLK